MQSEHCSLQLICMACSNQAGSGMRDGRVSQAVRQLVPFEHGFLALSALVLPGDVFCWVCRPVLAAASAMQLSLLRGSPGRVLTVVFLA